MASIATRDATGRSLQGKAGIAEVVRKMNCIQFDPIDVTGRNHELVLEARVRGVTATTCVRQWLKQAWNGLRCEHHSCAMLPTSA